MDTRSLVPLVKDQPNRGLLESLRNDSVLLKRLEEDFKNAFDGRHIDVVSFYETKKSPTAVEVADGRWELSGPPEVLVDGPSATYGSEPQHQHPIDRSHSEMVKYSNYYDELYTDVRTVLQPLLSKARSMRATVGVEAGHNLSLPHSTKSIVARESHFRVPFGRNRDFVGRESILAQLLRTIPPSVEVDDCQRTAIEGRGGVGKSQIALEAAFRVCDQFPGCSIFWVPAVDATSFENVYREIGRQLGIKGIEEDKADVKTLVKEALSRESSGHWLLIIDNADDPGLLFSGMALSDCLPFSRKGSVLFTTQRREVAVRLDVPERNIVTAEEMNEAEAMDLLLKGLNSHGSNLKDLKNLIIFLEKLPLAIKQASAYIAKTRMPVAKYLDHCKSSNKTLIKLLSKDFEDRGRYKGTEHPVAMTWLISFKRISRDNPVAAQYLKFISLLAEYDIPISLLPPASHQLEAHETIGILKAYAFITNRDTHDSFDMHRLVRLATRNWLDEKGKHKECVTEVILRLHQVFPLPQIDNKDTWIKYLPHLEAALGSRERSADKAASHQFYSGSQDIAIVFSGLEKHLRKKPPSGEGTADEAASVLLGIAGYCYYVLGQYRKAEQKTRQGLELVQKLLDKEDPYVLSRMVILGYVLEAGGKYEEAEGVLRQAMDVQEKVLGKDHPDTLCTMDTLTAFLISQGKYEEAEGMLRRTVELREKAFGKEHPDTLSSLSDLAIVLKSQGKRENAVALMEKCHQLWVQEFGLDDCDARRSFKLLNDWKIEG
ncbi:hypothetical protein IFM46972_08475 [Aspergillus udagawae]|uniref:NB-ARC domain-containing protein n=1 Tax=Aspergillus udagawae TaxID=91492 RepID=A0A8H3S301_9EURO|nr:hypothetical protein IFM46972_08475 [Aspergillus udagawae]